MVQRLLRLYESWKAGSDAAPLDGDLAGSLAVPPGIFLMQTCSSPDPHVYLRMGERNTTAIRELLAAHGIPLAGAVLDFGCGCGRELRWWCGAADVELHGCDYNGELALWSRANLPLVRVALNPLRPPAPYRDGKFDILFALDTLTHLDEAGQRQWMRDFHRMLRPGGYLIVSTQGDLHRQNLSILERRRFSEGQLIVRNPGSAGSKLCMAYHPPQAFRQKLTQGFEEAAHRPGGWGANSQDDVWLLRRSSG